MTKELSKDTSVDRHKVAMGYKTIKRKIGENLTTVGAVFWKWNKMTIVCLWPGAPCKILPHAVGQGKVFQKYSS